MPPVVILTSAVGLGVYIPALLIRRQLQGLGVAVGVEVLEDLYTPRQQASHIAHAEAHHANFALAQMAHRMARDVQDCLDGERVGQCLRRWADRGCRHFIVWSGFWLPVLERYRRLSGLPLEIDHCRIDAEISASFKVHADLAPRGREIWLWHGAAGRLVHEIPVSEAAPLPFDRRSSRLAVHGGGWGIGTYRERLAELGQAGFALDVVLHGDDEAAALRPGDTGYRLRPGWRAWQRDDAGELRFPPMERLDATGFEPLPEPSSHHGFYEVIRRDRAIVSKPGGCTLIDSLASATPVVLLEPYGYAEARNAEIWRALGFGIDYGEWRAAGFDPAMLERLHRNLLGHAGRGIDYPRDYALRLRRGAGA